MSLELWAVLIALTTSVLCSVCGCLLLVKQQAMVSEGLSHAVLPGLVVAFILFRDYNSPWLIIGAGLSGLIMVWLCNLLQRTRLVEPDAALGIVFSAMFSVGILIVSQNLRNVHFHADCILDGNLALAPLSRWEWAGSDWGPSSLYTAAGMLLIVLGFIVVCYKELQLMLFDESLATQFRFRPALMQMIWLALVSLTTVVSFEVAGSILIVAFMLAPPAAAYLFSDRLIHLLVGSVVLAVISTVGGFYWARVLDIAPTGPMASFAGIVFLITLFVAPKRGLLSVWWKRRTQRQQVLDSLILRLIASHFPTDSTPATEQLFDSLSIPDHQLEDILAKLTQQDLIRKIDENWQLTSTGQRFLAQQEQLFGIS